MIKLCWCLIKVREGRIEKTDRQTHRHTRQLRNYSSRACMPRVNKSHDWCVHRSWTLVTVFYERFRKVCLRRKGKHSVLLLGNLRTQWNVEKPTVWRRVISEERDKLCKASKRAFERVSRLCTRVYWYPAIILPPNELHASITYSYLHVNWCIFTFKKLWIAH